MCVCVGGGVFPKEDRSAEPGIETGDLRKYIHIYLIPMENDQQQNKKIYMYDKNTPFFQNYIHRDKKSPWPPSLINRYSSTGKHHFNDFNNSNNFNIS